MESAFKILRAIAIIAVVAILGGIGGWYYYLHSKQLSIASLIPGHKAAPQTPSTANPSNPSANTPAPRETVNNPIAATPAVDMPHAPTRLWRADQGPVSGFSFIAEPASASTSVHLYFAERANGNVFDADAVTQQLNRLTNTLIPKAYEAVFSPKGGTVAMRTLQGETVNTILAAFATPASTSTFPGALNGPALLADIRVLTIDPDPRSGKLFYVAPGANGQTGVFLSSTANAKPKQLFSSPIASWHLSVAGGKLMILEAPAEHVDGYAYMISDSGALSLYAGPLPGLMILPHQAGGALLFSSSGGGRIALYAQVGKSAPVALPLQTVAEKCAWDASKKLIAYCAVPAKLPSNNFITNWYQGALHTSDSIWQIDASNGTAQQLFTPNQPLDVRDPQVDPSGQYLAFENGADMSLWVLKLVQ